MIVFAPGRHLLRFNATLCLLVLFNLLSNKKKSFLKKVRSLFEWCAATCKRLFTSTYTWSHDFVDVCAGRTGFEFAAANCYTWTPMMTR